MGRGVLNALLCPVYVLEKVRCSGGKSILGELWRMVIFSSIAIKTNRENRSWMSDLVALVHGCIMRYVPEETKKLMQCLENSHPKL